MRSPPAGLAKAALPLALLWLLLLSLMRIALAAPEPAPSPPQRLRYGVIATNAPLETYSAAKKHEGLAATTLEQVAALLELRVEPQPFVDEATAIEALRAGKVDCISLRLLEGSELKGLESTSPYLRLPLALLARDDATATPARLAVPEQAEIASLAEQEFPDSRRVPFARAGEAAKLLADGRVDAVLADPVALAYAAARLEPPLKLKVQRQFAPTIVAVFALANGQAALRDRIQIALQSLPRERAEHDRREWLTGLGLAPVQASAPDDSQLPAQGEAVKTLLAQLDKDTSVTSSARDALKSAADRMLRREQDGDSLKGELEALEALEIEAERESARMSQLGPGNDLELGFMTWRAQLGTQPVPGELWSQTASVREQIDALRKHPITGLQERASAAGQARAGKTAASGPLDLGRLALELPAVPGYSARILEAARLIERRSAALEDRIAAARRRSLQVRALLNEIETRQRDAALALAERKLDYLEVALGRSLGSRLSPLRQSARQVLAEASPGEQRREHAQAILELADEGEKLARRLLELNREQDADADRQNQIMRALVNTRERLEVASNSSALGLILVSELERSVPRVRIERELETVRRELAGVRLRLVTLREAPRLSGAPLVAGQSTSELVLAIGEGGPASEQELAAARARLVVAIETANVGLADTLAQIERMLLETTRSNNELRNLIRQRLLWTPSHGPVDLAWFEEAVASLESRAVLAIGPQAYAAGSAWVRAHPWAAIVLALLAVALLAARPLLWRAVAARRADLVSVRTDRIGHTLAALGCTLVLALPWGIGLMLLFFALGGGITPSRTYQVLFGQVHPELWLGVALGTLYHLADDRGAGTSDFGWAGERRARMRRTVLSAILWLIPGYVFIAACWYRGNLVAVEFGGRVLLMLAWVAMSAVAWRVFAPGVLWFRAEETGESQWGRRVLRLVATASALSVSAYAALGYELTAAAIARSLTLTAAVLALLTVIHALALRWIAIGEKRVAVDAALARREARREGADTAVLQAEREGEQIAQVSAQSRRLVDFLVLVAAVVLLGLVWSEMLPAVRRLGEIAMWEVNVEREGKALVQTVSVLDLVLALATAALLVVALRTVPSMLDLVLRQRAGSDPGTRFAAAALTRYFITLVGVVVTFGLLGLRWDHLQWLAAALTVGLGFGLQEIFANFVSGLIVLFERKVRVGDVITVGNVSGTVTSISTRASTLLDWDRKEVMVPNKTLITEQLTNWTLTDAVTRLSLKIGVAYGSDPDAVHRTLVAAARAEPLVLSEPEPESFFTGLGASSMDFELRVFVQRVDQRPDIASALYRALVERLRAAGIAIAFPQLDLWVRSMGPSPAAAPVSPQHDERPPVP